jgi:pimeloyl-ACP methyl ester carboxylesterase
MRVPIERLDTDRYRCIAIDLPGMGTRADDAGPYDLARLTGAVLDAIDGVTAPVIIVGHSMGAQVAERAAVAAVAAIVLLTPVVLSCRRR